MVGRRTLDRCAARDLNFVRIASDRTAVLAARGAARDAGTSQEGSGGTSPLDSARGALSDSRRARGGVPWLVHVIPLLILFIAAGTTGRAQDSKIWNGVYSAEQAEQGKKVFESNCATCHRSDLTGDRGPSLVGDRFFTSWQGGSVNRLYSKIKETMPPNNRNSNLTEDNVLSLVAFILESNTFPPSKEDTLLTTEVIEDVIIARRDGGGSGLPNFALVQVVGCLAQGPDKQWRLTSSSEPVLTKDQPATAQELQEGLAKPLGTDTFVLQSVARFKPETYQGQKMAAKGLVYKSPNDSLISLTSLQVVDSKCGS